MSLVSVAKIVMKYSLKSFESIKGNQGQTIRYREHLYELCLGTTIKDGSKKQKIPYTMLERIFYEIAEEKAQKQQEQDRYKTKHQLLDR